MAYETARGLVCSQCEDAAVLPPEFDSALLGVGERFGEECMAVYSLEKVLRILMKKNSWERDEAVEWFEFNILGSSPGGTTPVFVTTVS